jgi:hypothetical protein
LRIAGFSLGCTSFYNTNKRRFTVNKLLVALSIVSFASADIFAQEYDVIADSMVVEFYARIRNPLYWFPSKENWFSPVGDWFSGKGARGVEQWLGAIESAKSLGIIANEEHIGQVRAVLSSKPKIDSITKVKTDALVTDLVLHFIKDLQQGHSHFDYDEISVNRDSLYISQLLKPKFLKSVSRIVSELDCKDHDYRVYKKFLRDSVSATDSLKRKTIFCAMNYRRFFSTNRYSEYLLVNISQTEATYFKNGVLAITMRTVVGKKTKQTPTIASYITSITTFPDWNVPYQIAVDEILPKVQKNEDYLEQNSYEVVDANGNEVDDSDIRWSDYTARNFTCFFRQSSGAGNALGVVKFDLQDPFSIFLHGTSNQKTFSKEYRFLSHGCIRLEKPFDLADSLLRGKLDVKELETGKTDKKPTVIALQSKIPTFIIYMPVKIDNEKVAFLKDEYGLIK